MMKNQKLVRDIFSRIPNLRIHNFFVLFSFKGAAKCLFFVKINSFSNIFDLSRKKTYLVLKENKKIFVKKIRVFLDSEFVKTCHEQVTTRHQLS